MNEKLKEGIDRIQSILSEDTVNLSRLKEELIFSLQYSCSESGRTDQNCREVDAFFSANDLWVERDLPEDFHDVFALMSEALHDTVGAPEIAENFGCTPEQLLNRAKKLNT